MNFEKFQKNNVIYHCLGDDINEGILACGYMRKPGEQKSQIDFTIGYYSCFLLLRGSGFYHDSHAKTIPIQAGSVVQRLPDTRHSTHVYPDGQWLEFFISFGKPVFDYLQRLGMLNLTPPVFEVSRDDAMLHSFDQFLGKMKHAQLRHYPQLLLDAQKIVLALHEHVDRQTSYKTYRHAIHKACSILSSPAGRVLSLEQVAEQTGMNYELFRKVFVKTTGKPPAAYRIDYTMQQACMMLHSGIPIKAVAAELGYSDTYSFTKQFTKNVGVSPGAYRKAIY